MGNRHSKYIIKGQTPCQSHQQQQQQQSYHYQPQNAKSIWEQSCCNNSLHNIRPQQQHNANGIWCYHVGNERQQHKRSQSQQINPDQSNVYPPIDRRLQKMAQTKPPIDDYLEHNDRLI